MKPIKTSIALLLAAALAASLFGCTLFGAEDEADTEIVALTPLPADAASALAYLSGTLLGDAAKANSVTIETSYGVADVQTDNKTLKAAAKTIQGVLVEFLHNTQEKIIPTAADAPALFVPLAAGDVQEITVQDVLEMQLAERVVQLKKDVIDGRNPELKDAAEEELLAFALEQLGERSAYEAKAQYQVDAVLATAAGARLIAPADETAIRAELDKAHAYLLVERYTLQPTALTLYARVEKTTDRLKELRLTETAAVTLTATGVGALQDAGAIPVTFTLTKTVTYRDFEWKKAR